MGISMQEVQVVGSGYSWCDICIGFSGNHLLEIFEKVRKAVVGKSINGKVVS